MIHIGIKESHRRALSSENVKQSVLYQVFCTWAKCLKMRFFQLILSFSGRNFNLKIAAYRASNFTVGSVNRQIAFTTKNETKTPFDC